MDKKNPIQLLQECLVKEGSSPTYLITTNERSGLIECTVNAKGTEVTGIADTKRKAKQKAAIGLLAKLYGNYEELGVVKVEGYEISGKHNCVGELQELCQKNYKILPLYKTVMEGSSLFNTNCKLGNFVTEGQGYNKQQSKHIAAQKMLSCLVQAGDANSRQKFPEALPNIKPSDSSQDPSLNRGAASGVVIEESHLESLFLNSKDLNDKLLTLIDRFYEKLLSLKKKHTVSFSKNEGGVVCCIQIDDLEFEGSSKSSCLEAKLKAILSVSHFLKIH